MAYKVHHPRPCCSSKNLKEQDFRRKRYAQASVPTVPTVPPVIAIRAIRGCHPCTFVIAIRVTNNLK